MILGLFLDGISQTKKNEGIAALGGGERNSQSDMNHPAVTDPLNVSHPGVHTQRTNTIKPKHLK
jgi:hypothetical protein